MVWPCIEARNENSTFKKWWPVETTEVIARGWIAGESFGDLYEQIVEAKVRIGLGARPRKPKIEHVVEMGENALGFDGAHILGSIIELYELMSSDDEETPMMALQTLQKRMTYGLPTGPSILLYEAGFSDRPLAIDLAEIVPGISSRRGVMNGLLRKQPTVEAILDRYPEYFRRVFERVIGL